MFGEEYSKLSISSSQISSFAVDDETCFPTFLMLTGESKHLNSVIPLNIFGEAIVYLTGEGDLLIVELIVD